ncbi:hypothetical protein LPTSP3_g29950 [Leptospira kobayashii]|uniref:Lipoprotein n=1 Tax=Leptospira kobayashii TaxID=1917830 RepID=A0ABM7UM68_9LEPT|nr:hypothetical protein [Leptospira kobayashii]BDA80065.1 hypothetical protein LPTSP3_g29950 [Leptospira kobayashii]
MKIKAASLAVSLGILSLFACKGSVSPEAKLLELTPKFQKVMCNKSIECTKDELAKIPAAYRNLIPPFMQSEENCISFFKGKFDEAQKKRETEKKEVTEEMVNAFETCISAMEKSSCDVYKGTKGKLNIPGCENMEKYSN